MIFPTDDGSLRFFDAIARRYDRVYGLDRDTSRRRMERVLRVLERAGGVGRNARAGGRVLDLGVGTGRELSALQDAGFEPTGVDISPRMLEQCARRARPVELVLADLWAPLPFASGSFEAVLALHGTLSHPPDADAPRRFAREVARVLAPDGVLIFEVPSPAWLARVTDASAPTTTSDEMRVLRVDAETCIHEDHVSRVAIAATVRSEAAWAELLAPELVGRNEGDDPFELFIVARGPRDA